MKLILLIIIIIKGSPYFATLLVTSEEQPALDK